MVIWCIQLNPLTGLFTTSAAVRTAAVVSDMITPLMQQNDLMQQMNQFILVFCVPVMKKITAGMISQHLTLFSKSKYQAYSMKKAKNDDWILTFWEHSSGLVFFIVTFVSYVSQKTKTTFLYWCDLFHLLRLTTTMCLYSAVLWGCLAEMLLYITDTGEKHTGCSHDIIIQLLYTNIDLDKPFTIEYSPNYADSLCSLHKCLMYFAISF